MALNLPNLSTIKRLPCGTMLSIVLDLVRGQRLTSKAPVPSPPPPPLEPPVDMEKGEPEVVRSNEYRADVEVEYM